MKRWVNKWYEIGADCNALGEPIPLRSIIAWHIVYRNFKFWKQG